MRDTVEQLNDIRDTLKNCLALLDAGYLTTVSVKIKHLVIRLDVDGLGTPIKKLQGSE